MDTKAPPSTEKAAPLEPSFRQQVLQLVQLNPGMYTATDIAQVMAAEQAPPLPPHNKPFTRESYRLRQLQRKQRREATEQLMPSIHRKVVNALRKLQQSGHIQPASHARLDSAIQRLIQRRQDSDGITLHEATMKVVGGEKGTLRLALVFALQDGPLSMHELWQKVGKSGANGHSRDVFDALVEEGIVASKAQRWPS